MRKLQAMKLIVITVLLLCSTAAGWAQFPNLYFTTPLGLQSGRNFSVDGTQKVDDTTMILTAPTLKLWRPSPRGEFSLTYQPQFELFAHQGHLSSWTHQAGLKGDYKMTPRWSIDVRDVFVVTRDNNLRFDSAFLLPRGPYRENAAFLKLNYDMDSQTRIKLHFDNAFVSFREDRVARPLFFSRLTNTYGLTAEHRLSPRLKLTGDYSYLRSHSFDKYDQFGFLVAPYPPTHVASLTYDYNVTPRILLEVSGGYVRNRINSYVVSGLVEKHFRRVVIGGGFSRYLSYLGSPATPGIQAISGVVSGRSLPPNAINDTVSFRAQRDVSNRVGLELALIGTRTTGLQGKNLKGLMARLRVSYKFADHVAVFWSAQFLGQNANELLPQAISRKGVFAGIEYTFSPTAEAVARRRDEYYSRNRMTSLPVDEKTREDK